VQQNSKEDQEPQEVFLSATIDGQDAVNGTSQPAIVSEAERSTEEDVLDAAAWVQQALALEDANLDALWYERIAQTFSQNYEAASAKQQYEKAKELGGGWTIDEGWALAVNEMSQTEGDPLRKKELQTLACERLETVLQHLRPSAQTSEAGDGERQDLVRNVKRLAEWQEALKCLDRAFALYEEALVLEPRDHVTRGVLLKAVYAEKGEAEARNMLVRMINQKEPPTNLDLFPAFLCDLAENEMVYFSLEPLHIIIFLGSTDQAFNGQVSEAIRTTIADVRRSSATITEGALLLYQGVCLARGTADKSRIQEAIRCWDDCQSLYLPSRYDLGRTRGLAARFVAQRVFHEAKDQNSSAEEREKNFQQLLRVNRPTTLWLNGFQPTSYLASYYVLQGQVEEARRLFREDMIAAFVILSDGDPDNDVFGYKTIANLLMHTGDDLNALSAWSLLGPDDVFKTPDQEGASDKGSDSAKPQELETPGDGNDTCIASAVEGDIGGDGDKPMGATDRNGPLGYSCDGFCGRNWWYASDIYVCRYCPDTQFTGDCVEKLKANKLERYICDPGHSWLHVPKWSDQDALEVGQGKVRVHGQLVDGKRVGGDIIEIQQWLDEVRDIWGLPKPERVVELEQPLK
jgi:tetratricopeptide (TPR) repeat protein